MEEKNIFIEEEKYQKFKSEINKKDDYFNETEFKKISVILA